MKLPVLSRAPDAEPLDEMAITNPLIGICGFLGTGKSLLAERICRHVKRSAVIMPLAGPVKEFALSLGWNGKKDAKGRRLLQLLGTECGRNCIDQDIWLKLWAKDALRRARCGQIVIADDVRFPNEAAKIIESGGMMIRITRPGYEKQRRKWWHLRTPRMHATEKPDKLPIAFTFDNDGDAMGVDWIGGFVADSINRRFPYDSLSRY